MHKYSVDREWSDRFIPTLRNLIGPYLLVPSSLEQDTKEAADLVVLKARDMTVACRVRRSQYAQAFHGQFTIRSQRDSGAETELSKITNGWGDWFFYGFATGRDLKIEPWWLIDLSAFRAHFIREGIRKQQQIKWGVQANGDGTHFCWFQIESFPSKPPLLVASSSPDAPEAVLSPTSANPSNSGKPVTAADIKW